MFTRHGGRYHAAATLLVLLAVFGLAVQAGAQDGATQPPPEPKPPEYEPGVAPVEEPPRSPPVDPGDDRPYSAAVPRVPSVTSPD